MNWLLKLLGRIPQPGEAHWLEDPAIAKFLYGPAEPAILFPEIDETLLDQPKEQK